MEYLKKNHYNIFFSEITPLIKRIFKDKKLIYSKDVYPYIIKSLIPTTLFTIQKE